MDINQEKETPNFWELIKELSNEDSDQRIKKLEDHLTLAYIEYGIAIKALKKIGIEHYYLPQTVAKEALKQLGEYSTLT